GTSLKEIAKLQIAQSFSKNQKFINNQKVSDHHAIIPTEVRPDMQQLTQRESKIYMMIAQRFLENLMPPHEYEAVAINLLIENYKFVLKDKSTTKIDFKAIYENKEAVNNLVDQVSEGSKQKITQYKIDHQETTPPSYFNEGTLLK